MPHLVVMAAGTGGHIIPGLAVAREMQGRGWTVSWLGTRHGMENKLVPPQAESGIALDTIGFSGLRGKGPVHALTGGLRLLKAFWDCLGILRKRSAGVLLRCRLTSHRDVKCAQRACRNQNRALMRGGRS